MSEISASTVMALRKATSCGLMECKKALAESNGDLKAAQALLRQSGALKADKKQDRLASEGVVAVLANSDATAAVMLEVNSETDFVARDEHFKTFVDSALSAAMDSDAEDASALASVQTDSGETVEDLRKALIAKIGENIQVRRMVKFQAPEGGVVAHYVHGGRLGVLLTLNVNELDLGKDLAMHVTANQPIAVDESDCDSDVLAQERAVYQAQADESGKPEDIKTRMVEGRVKKFLQENTLLAQPFVKNPDVTVSELLKPSKGQVMSFELFVLGAVSG
ncbi:MAG: elongation factor Ts [Legionellales bacterium]|nr:elongation factor Ts [Legionellales bacterium]|tara:strand:+ start:1670 stop:2506 length:837 start_codon:yes stop_codon:yes gene_type:complete